MPTVAEQMAATQHVVAAHAVDADESKRANASGYAGCTIGL
jgi:hypothetical protein